MGFSSFRAGVLTVFIVATASFSNAIEVAGSAAKVYFADVNNDGLLDLIQGQIPELHVYLNNGSVFGASFPNSSEYTVRYSQNYLTGAAADQEFQGVMDLYVGSANGRVMKLDHGGSPASPTPVYSTVVNNGTSSSYGNIDVADQVNTISFVDFDGDGDRDIVICSFNAVLAWYQNQDFESDGWVDGIGVTYVNSSYSGLLDTVQRGINAKTSFVDWQGDGSADIAAGGGSSSNVQVILNTGTPDNPIYGSSSKTITTSGTEVSAFMADFDGDGILDMYYTTGGGDFTFVPSVNYSGGQDGLSPSIPDPGFHRSSATTNTVTLAWPRATDAGSSYVSGVKSYTLYVSVDQAIVLDGAGVPTNGTVQWKYYTNHLWADTVTGMRKGDKFKVVDGVFYYMHSSLKPGSTYYYRLVVEDFAQNTSTYPALSDITFAIEPAKLDAVTVSVTPTGAGAAGFRVTVNTVDQYGGQYEVTAPDGGENVTLTAVDGVDSNTVYPLSAAGARLDGGSSTTWSGVVPTGVDCVKSLRFVAAVRDTSSPDPFTGRGGICSYDGTTPAFLAIQEVAAADIGFADVTVSWGAVSDACSGLARYKAYFKAPGDVDYRLAGETQQAYYKFTGLDPGVLYRFTATGVDQAGNELKADAATPSVTATTLLDTTGPTTPTGVTAAYDTTFTHIIVSWIASSDGGTGVSGYEIQKKDGDDASFVTVATVSAPTVSWKDYQAYPNHKIYYMVRAYDSSAPPNYSGWSAIATADKASDTEPPSQPTNLSAGALDSRRVQLAWNGSYDSDSGLKGYRVFNQNVSLVNPIAETTETAYTVIGLLPDTTYVFRVAAVDNANNQSAMSSSATAKTPTEVPTVPNAPTTLRSTATSVSSITMAWNAPVANGITVAGYRIYTHASSTSPTPGALLASPTGLSYTAASLAGNTTYYFTATAVSPTGAESGHSNRLQVATQKSTITNPSGLTAATIGSDFVDLTWTPSVPSVGTTIKIYEVCKAKVSIAGYTCSMVVGTPTTASLRVTGLSPSTAYKFMVRAIASNLETSGYSGVIDVTTKAAGETTVPNPPSNLHSTATGTTTVSMAWSAPVANGATVASYKVYRHVSSTSPTPGTLLATQSGLNYTATGLAANTAHYFTATAVSSSGVESGHSNRLEAATAGAVPNAPANLRQTSAGTGSVDMAWDVPAANGVAVASYKVYRHASSTSPTPGTLLATQAGLTYAATGLASNTTYYFTVTAVSAGDAESGHSNRLEATTANGAPSAPTALTAANIWSDFVDLTWNPSVPVSGTTVSNYEVCLAKASIAGYTCSQILGAPTSAAFRAANLSPSTAYIFMVRAVASTGENSGYSDVLTVTTKSLEETAPPNAPSNLRSTAAGATTVDMTWSAPVANGVTVASYRVYKHASSTSPNPGTLLSTQAGLSYTATGLSADTAHYFTVTAVSPAGFESVHSNRLEVSTAKGVPSTPTGLTAANTWSDFVDIVWNPSVPAGGTTVSNYEVCRAKASIVGYTCLEVLGSPTTPAFRATGLSPSTEYLFIVRAISNTGESSAYSDALAVTTKSLEDTTPPNPPANLRSTASGVATIDMAWDAPAANGVAVASYKIYKHATSTSPTPGTLLATQAGTTYTAADLAANATYYFTVTAASQKGLESTHSNRLEAATAKSAPSAPTGLTAGATGTDFVELSWTPSVPVSGTTISNYEVCIAEVTPAGNTCLQSLGFPSDAAFRVTGLAPSTAYAFIVRATASTGEKSGYSDILDVTTKAVDVTAPPVPGNLRVTALTKTKVSLAWDPVTDESGGSGLKKYKLYRDGVDIYHPTSAFQDDSQVVPGKTYVYTVSAVDDSDNESAQSAPVSAKPPADDRFLYVAHVAETEMWATSLYLVNVGEDDNPVVIEAINAVGQTVQTKRIETLPANRSIESGVASMFAASDFLALPQQDLWLKVTSASKLKGMVRFGTTDLSSETAIPVFSAGATDLVFPYVYQSDIYYTGITLVNPGAEAATVTLYAYSETGNQLGSSNTAIGPGNKYAKLVDQVFPDVADFTSIRSVKVQSDKPLVGFELFGSLMSGRSGLAGLPAYSATTDMYKSALGGGSAGLDFLATEGRGEEVPMAAPSKPAGFQGTALSPTEILFTWDANPEVEAVDHYTIINNSFVPSSTLVDNLKGLTYILGGLKADTSYQFSLRAVNGAGEKSDPSTVITVKTLTVEGADPYMLVFNEIPDPERFYTGLTFSNLGSVQADVNVQVYDANGVKLVENTITSIKPQGQFTDNVVTVIGGELPPGAAYIRLGSKQRLQGFELFLNWYELPEPYKFEGVIGMSSGMTSAVFPLVLPDWTPAIRATNLLPAANTVTVTAFGADGVPKGVYTVSLPGRGRLDVSLSGIFPSTAAQIAWVKVAATLPLVSDIFMVSPDLGRLISYIALDTAD